MYTQGRVDACNRGDLGGSREIRYPLRVCLDGGEIGVMGVDGTSDEDFEYSAQLGKQVNMALTLLQLLHGDAKIRGYDNSKVL